MMTKTGKKAGKRYLHLADNNSLNNSDKFAKTYFGKHGAKQYIHSKPIRFGFNLWFMATPLGYCIQFRPYAGKDSCRECDFHLYW